MEKLLPHDIEAEQGVLGSILLDPEATLEVAAWLKPADFYRDSHRTIYTAIMHLYERHEPADLITLCDEIERKGNLEGVGGPSYITSLINCVPTSGNITYYGRIVQRTAVLRRLIHAAGRIAAAAYEEVDANAALATAEQLIFEIGRSQGNSDFSSDSQIMGDYLEDLDLLQQYKGAIVGVPTGYRKLDFFLGGMQRSDLIVLAARPGMGKSSLMLNIADNAVLKHGARVAIFSLEMSKKQLMQRRVSRDARIDLYKLRNGQLQDEEDWDRIATSVGTLSTNRLWIDDTGGISISALCSKARRLHAQQRLNLIIVDYLQLITVEGKSNENRVQVIGEITHGLKALAKELDIPILALAQLSRAVELRTVKIPQLADCREGGDIENDADVILFIYRDEYYNSKTDRPGIADVIIAKHRNGPLGEVALGFEPRFTEFVDKEQE